MQKRVLWFLSVLFVPLKFCSAPVCKHASKACDPGRRLTRQRPIRKRGCVSVGVAWLCRCENVDVKGFSLAQGAGDHFGFCNNWGVDGLGSDDGEVIVPDVLRKRRCR